MFLSKLGLVAFIYNYIVTSFYIIFMQRETQRVYSILEDKHASFGWITEKGLVQFVHVYVAIYV